MPFKSFSPQRLLQKRFLLQATYDFFCSLDKEEKGYILDVSNGVKVLFETVAKLICHPLQRAPQNEAFYSIMSVPPEQNVPEVS